MGTSNIELIEIAKNLNIPNFRGVICRDEFYKLKPSLENETGIYNYNDSSEGGSHWAAYCKRGEKWYHFCSYGSKPCIELKKYADGGEILSHNYRIQDFDEKNCGEWCILFCYLISNPKLKYENVVLFLV